jgi:hypothetical protein
MPGGQRLEAPTVFALRTLFSGATALGDPGLAGDVFGALARGAFLLFGPNPLEQSPHGSIAAARGRTGR